MTHDELSDIAAGLGLEVILFPNLEAALTGYVMDQGLDGTDTIRAVYDHDKILDCLVQQSMSDPEADKWFCHNAARTAECFAADRKGPMIIYTHQ